MSNTHPDPATLVQALADRTAGHRSGPAAISQTVATDVYTCPARYKAEKDKVFLQYPLIVGHQSQIPNPGDALTFDWLGLPLITIRDKNGDIGTFLNVCRHRGMRLLQEEGCSNIRSLVCPYHQWTYGLDGQLRNIPLQESFDGVEKENFGLVALPTEVRHGLIWVQATPGEAMNLDEHLAGLGADLDVFSLADYSFCARSVKQVNCNWKLVQDAFLDGYHVTRLHKDTVGSFFPDSMAESDHIGRHIRSAVARNEISEAIGLPVDELDLRHHATFSYTLFPNVVLVLHPEYTSIISLFPKSADETIFVHSMLTPQPPESEEQRAHFQRSFELIDEGVFEAEDLFVSAGAQRGMLSGANESLLFGAFERTAVEFHQILETALQQ
jgi:Rieske 2Fe-2S family protein